MRETAKLRRLLELRKMREKLRQGRLLMARNEAERSTKAANSARNRHQNLESQARTQNHACLAKAETSHDPLTRFSSISAALRKNRSHLEDSATQVADRMADARESRAESARSSLRYHDAVKARSAFSTLIERLEKQTASRLEIAEEDALSDVHISQIGRRS